MIKIIKSLFYIFLIISLISACKKTKDPFQANDGFDYYPLYIGKYIIYEVDSTIYNPTGDSLISFSKTFVKEEIVDTLSDNEGHTLYRIERFEKKDMEAPWEIKKVLSVALYDNQAFRTEDNLKFMPLVFPVKENKSWDGNLFFDELQTVIVAGESIEMFKDWSAHRMRNVGQAETVLGFDFEEVLTVTASNSADNKIEFRRWEEKYARSIGLVFRELWILDTQCDFCCGGDFSECDKLPWEEKAEKGFILRQGIIDHN